MYQRLELKLSKRKQDGFIVSGSACNEVYYQTDKHLTALTTAVSTDESCALRPSHVVSLSLTGVNVPHFLDLVK